ncbi:MAG: hypothetical protein ABI164_00165 [Acidobacteriaceae bacterium]
MKHRRKWRTEFRAGCIAVLATVFGSMVVQARVIQANPANVKSLLTTLSPGDTLVLAPGIYDHLDLYNLTGTPQRWITVTGAESPEGTGAAVISENDCCNTVEIKNSSYLAVENLRIDSEGVEGVFGISAGGGLKNLVHDILIQGNILIGQNVGQQTDGISTKTPTWNWTIRENKILGAGTGMYLGNSDGSDPFVHGVIENNLVQDPIGYCMQIKDQKTWPSVPGLPTGPTTTIIRNNTFIKSDGPSPDGDRPNLYVGGYPDSGPGSTNMYEVYGNFFDHNPREALLQVTGRVSIHDNLLVDGQYTAVEVANHKFSGITNVVKLVYLYNNTIYTSQNGIEFDSPAQEGSAAVGNVIFAATPITGTVTSESNNLTDAVANAGNYLAAPTFILGQMNFYPLPGKVEGAPLPLNLVSSDTDYNLDFNGIQKDKFSGQPVFRGAYAGEGVNPGWKVQAGIKPRQHKALYWAVWLLLQNL